jgi:hypothetical protein
MNKHEWDNESLDRLIAAIDKVEEEEALSEAKEAILDESRKALARRYTPIMEVVLREGKRNRDLRKAELPASAPTALELLKTLLKERVLHLTTMMLDTLSAALETTDLLVPLDRAARGPVRKDNSSLWSSPEMNDLRSRTPWILAGIGAPTVESNIQTLIRFRQIVHDPRQDTPPSPSVSVIGDGQEQHIVSKEQVGELFFVRLTVSVDTNRPVDVKLSDAGKWEIHCSLASAE